MAGVHVPAMRQQDSAMDIVAKGLNIAQSIYGLKTTHDENKAKDAKAADVRDGVFNQQELLDNSKGMEPAQKGAEGSVLMKGRRGDAVEENYFKAPQKPGLRTPTRAIQTVENGKNVTRIVDDVSGASYPVIPPKEKQKSGLSTPKATEGEKVVDREFAKEYNTWTSGAGQGARSEIIKLRGVADALRSGKVETGGLTGIMPDRMTSKEILKVRADVESTVMNSLKAILGNAFTEKEGQRIIKATWNESDTTENNLSRIERLVSGLENQANAKDDKSMYFADNGTLNGWKPSQNKSNVAKDGSPKQNSGDAFAAPADGGKVMVSNGKETLMIDPNDLESAAKDGFKPTKGAGGSW